MINYSKRHTSLERHWKTPRWWRHTWEWSPLHRGSRRS